jgi:ABC-type transport system involved in multi-copper enzyme maturation permease subunit
VQAEATTIAQPPAPGPFSGFAVLLDKEVAEARRSKRMIAFLLVMTLVVSLVPIISYFNIDDFGDGFRSIVTEDDMDRIVVAWAGLAAYLISLMVIASTVDAVTSERALGVSAWIVTKPVSRLTYLLAKAAAHTLVACVTLVIIPTLVFIVLTVALFEGVPVVYVILAAGMLCLEVAFLTFSVVAIGVTFRSVAPIAIIALAFWFMPNAVPAVQSLEWTTYIIPSFLPFIVIATAVAESGRFTFTIPLASVVMAALLFAGGVWWFERQEL